VPPGPRVAQHLLFDEHVFAEQAAQVDEIPGDDAAGSGHIRKSPQDVSEQLALLDVLPGELRCEVFSPRTDLAQRRSQMDVFPLHVYQKCVEATDRFASERAEVMIASGEDAPRQTLQPSQRSPQSDVVAEDPLPDFICFHAFSQSGYGKCSEPAEAERK